MKKTIHPVIQLPAQSALLKIERRLDFLFKRLDFPHHSVDEKVWAECRIEVENDFSLTLNEIT